jgi:hypothetical protein
MRPEKLEQLRTLHSCLTYKNYSYVADGKNLVITYHFHLSPDIDFKPTITIPFAGSANDISEAETLIFATGLIELISYWKCACAPHIMIECGRLDGAHTAFLKKLLINGMGEFYFVNEIDFTPSDFISISSSGKKHLPVTVKNTSGDCVLVAGGKDSSLLLELLKGGASPLKALSIVGSPATDTSVAIAGIPACNHLKISRVIDRKLIELNAKGYANGHTPFSALIAHLSLLVGALHQIKNFYVGNERSASEANTTYRGLAINHQYSKSVEFERDFRALASTHLTAEVTYTSFLRPLYEIQIAKLFSRYPQHFSNFKSCNVNQKKNTWCLNCSKCLFVYLMMRPWINEKQTLEIFSGNPLSSPRAKELLEELCGLSPVKPLECVGTRSESVLGAHLTLGKLHEEKLLVPESLLTVTNRTTPDASLLKDISAEHFLTMAQLNFLKEHLTSKTSM